MAHSTLRSSVEESNLISEFIESGKFHEYFKNNILLDNEFLYSSESEEDSVMGVKGTINGERKKSRNFKPPGRSSIKDYFAETEWGRNLKDESVKDPNSKKGQVFIFIIICMLLILYVCMLILLIIFVYCDCDILFHTIIILITIKDDRYKIYSVDKCVVLYVIFNYVIIKYFYFLLLNYIILYILILY